MAETTLGIGTSHCPMLSTPPEALAGLGDLDRGRLAEFAGKARENAAWIGRELVPEVTRARHEATQAAIQQLRGVLAEEAPDALVVIGDDQDEWFSADNQPALCIYWGETVENLPPPIERVPPLRHVLQILAKKDADALSALPAAKLESGNSEIRNWITAAGALEHLQMQLVDYVPSYRSEAGSGVGMAFAVWQ